MRPKPTTPTVLPVTSVPSIHAGSTSVQPPERTIRSASTTRRAAARSSAIAWSAVASVRTPGVFVTSTPRRRHASRSTWFTPTP